MKLTNLAGLALVATLSQSFALNAFAAAGAAPSVRTCKSIFRPASEAIGIFSKRVSGEKNDVVENFLSLIADGKLPGVASPIEIVKVLTDKDVPLFGNRLMSVYKSLARSVTIPTIQDFYRRLRLELRDDGLPYRLIDKGIEEHRAGKAGSLRRLLGDLTFEETRSIYMGEGATGTAFTAESSLGKYIAETGASIRVMPLKDTVTGQLFTEERLVVAVSEESFPKFLKYFGQKTVMSVFGHANIVNNGKAYSYGGPKSELRALSPNTPLPMLILKTSEGERLNRYVELAGLPKYQYWSNALKQPWRLKSPEGKPYVQDGAYSCCTNFVGNIPIGDKTVTEYVLPQFKAGVYGDHLPASPFKLSKWKDAGNTELENVWTVPGHEQLSSVVGQLDKNADGEWASPGYVIQTLYGHTTNERVPIVFLFMANHKEPIPVDPNLNFEQPR